MTLAQVLLAPIGLLMAVDYWQTRRGLTDGLEEGNQLALETLNAFGFPGLVALQVAMFAIALAVAVLWPAQWAFSAWWVAELLYTVWSNERLMRNDKASPLQVALKRCGLWASRMRAE